MKRFVRPKESRIPFTQKGYDDIVSERNDLTARRPAAVENLRKAREMGDLSENGYYKAARAELSFIDARLRRATRLIKLAVIVNNAPGDTVQIGSTVTVTSDKGEQTYMIVGGYESDPANQTISHQSPLGRALMGRKLGDRATVHAPAGTLIYTISKLA